MMKKQKANSYIVFGLGISGIATVKFLLLNDYSVLASDDNQSSIDNLLNEIKKFPELNSKISNLKTFNNPDEVDWSGIGYLVLAPGISLKYPEPHKIVLKAQQNNCEVICDLELFYLFNPEENYLGITGTNGKSTTTALTYHIFKENNLNSAMGGNIGVPCFSMPKLSKNATYIFETSSYQLDLIHKTRFHIASLLNITPDHLDRHLNMEGYIAAKKRIFKNQKAGDFAVIGIDNENSKRVYEDLKNDPNFSSQIVPISTKIILKDGVSILNNIIYNNIHNQTSEIALGDLPFLQGEHNAQNIAVSFANAFLSKIDEQKILNAIQSFKGLKHRMQIVGKIGDIIFINDSKATNAESTENALKSFDNIYWILGGKPKAGGIEILKPYFSKIKYAFLIGDATEEFAKTLDNKVQYFKCGNLENAFKMAYEKAGSNENGKKNILLSPSCASFDQWKNFEERGDYFCKLVSNLQNVSV